MSFKPRVIDGGRTGQEQFVCPWCGASFERRFISSDGLYSLEEHWERSATCGKNRNVNNPKGMPTLEERWPCLPGERHTFPKEQMTCFCGALTIGARLELPFVTLIHPTAEEKS